MATIFISSKSQDFTQARKIYAILTAQGYSCFFSAETLQQLGETDYKEAIDTALESARHLVVVTSSRENADSKWVKYEWNTFSNELLSGRKDGNILTIVCAGLKADELPLTLRQRQVLSFESELHQLASFLPMHKARDKSEETVPDSSANKKQALPRLHGSLQRGIIAFLSIILIAGGFLTWEHFYNQRPSISFSDQQFLRSQASDIAIQLGRVNVELIGIRETARKATAYFAEHKNERAAMENNELAAWARHRLQELEKNRQEPLWQKDRATLLEKLGVPAQDVHALYTGWIPQFWTSVKEYYEKTELYAKMAPVGWVSEQARANELSAESLIHAADAMYYGVFSLFSHFPESSLEDFQKMRSQFTQFPSVSGMPGKIEADRQMEISLNKFNEALNAMTLIVGNADVAVQNTEKQINEKESSVQAQASDTPDDIAMKAWKCRLFGYRTKAIGLLEEYAKRFPDANAPERKYAETAQAFFEAAQQEKIAGAWYVTTVEKIPNGAPCALLEGDIVIQLNGKPVETAKAFFDYFKDHPGETAQIDLMRRSENGRFEKKQVPFKKDRKIGLMGI